MLQAPQFSQHLTWQVLTGSYLGQHLTLFRYKKQWYFFKFEFHSIKEAELIMWRIVFFYSFFCLDGNFLLYYVVVFNLQWYLFFVSFGSESTTASTLVA